MRRISSLFRAATISQPYGRLKYRMFLDLRRHEAMSLPVDEFVDRMSVPTLRVG
jgi:hypothetical protein